MTYIMLPDLEVVLFFDCAIIESFEKVFMHRLAMGCIIIYHTTIIPNALDKVTNYMKFKVVGGWLI